MLLKRENSLFDQIKRASRMRIPFFVSLIAYLMVPSLFLEAKQQESQERIAKLKTFMETSVERHLFRGSVLVVENGNVIFEYSYGDAEKHKRAITADSAFYLASVSKQFTASAIMLLQQDGKLSFDDRVSKHMPELPDWAHAITVRHLLTNTSGLDDYLKSDDLIKVGLSNDDVMQHTLKLSELEFKSGERYGYSNTGYALLARLVERISGKSFREFTSQRIFEPLDMNSAVFTDDSRPKIKDRVFGYNRFGVLDDNPMFTSGAGGMYASPRDLVKWNMSVINSTLLNEATLKEAFTPFKLNDGSNSPYGFGWHIHNQDHGIALHHTGGMAGFRNFVFVDLAKRNMVILLTNGGDSFPLSQMATGVTSILRNKPSVVPKASLTEHLFSLSKDDVDLRSEAKRINTNHADDFRIDEDSLNELGYLLLDKRTEKAKQLFQAVVDLFPDSANAYDSYAEALMKSGDYKLSRQNYSRSLKLDPFNENAEAMLAKLDELLAKDFDKRTTASSPSSKLHDQLDIWLEEHRQGWKELKTSPALTVEKVRTVRQKTLDKFPPMSEFIPSHIRKISKAGLLQDGPARTEAIKRIDEFENDKSNEGAMAAYLAFRFKTQHPLHGYPKGETNEDRLSKQKRSLKHLLNHAQLESVFEADSELGFFTELQQTNSLELWRPYGDQLSHVKDLMIEHNQASLNTEYKACFEILRDAANLDGQELGELRAELIALGNSQLQRLRSKEQSEIDNPKFHKHYISALEGQIKFLKTVNDVGSLIGSPAPVLNLRWSSDKNITSWKDTKGKICVLYFSTFGCGPCVKSVPELIELNKKIAKHPRMSTRAQFIGVTSQQGLVPLKDGVVDCKNFEKSAS